MGKSSSSYKKKRSKNSSQVRTRKSSKSKSRSKKYNKSKKLRRHDDSLSFSDNDDSRGSASVSCSGSQDDSRSRRARSRTRKDVKGSKKRTQRRSYSCESSEEGKKRSRGRSRQHESSKESPHVRKRIGSKRKESSEVGRKTQKKKKPRREASVSSVSRGSSCSCSSCQVGSTRNHESEFERHRGRSERKEKEKRKVEKVKSGTKRIRYRSRSGSSCSRSSENNEYWSEENKTGENNFNRLRSVITVREEENEDSVSNKDEHKEEIVYDNDDYPSCRSNDSNDGGYKRELYHQSNVASEKKMRVDNEKEEEPVISNTRTTEITESGKDFEGQYPSSSGVGRNDVVKGKVAEVSGRVDGDDLESILRQRALENLIRFRGGLQKNANTPASKKDKNDGDVKQPSTAKSELVQIKFPKDDGAKIIHTKSPKEDDAELQVATQEVREIRVPALRRASNLNLQNDEKTPENGGNKSGSAKQEYACAPAQVAVADKPHEKVNSAISSVITRPKLGMPIARHNSFKTHTTLEQTPAEVSVADKPHEKVNSAVGSVITRPKFGTPLARHNSFKTHTTLEQTPAPEEYHQANLSGSALVKSAAETAQIVSPSSNNSNEDVKNASGSAAAESSCVKSILTESGSNKPQDGTAEGSQFEQKTMTVMRGGEMVQVSYKVYIPKKVPALARRQLKR
ncbi:micronuclear linker histone polyprotein [Fagus crenata]